MPRKGQKLSATAKRAISRAQKAIWTPEKREVQRRAAIEQWSDPLFKQMQLVKRCGVLSDSERLRRSVALKQMWEDPAYRYRLSKKSKRGRQDYRDRQRKNWGTYLKRLYKLTVEEYARLLHSQDFACAICSKSYPQTGGNPDKFSVDHNHLTKEVRGILCGKCNSLYLGGFESAHRKGLLTKMQQYLLSA